MAMQLPLQRLAARRGGPEGIKVPQSAGSSSPQGFSVTAGSGEAAAEHLPAN